MPPGLSDEFATDRYKSTQWNAFLSRSQLEEETIELPQVVDDLRSFLVPVLDAAANAKDFADSWMDGGPWTNKR